MKTILPLIGLPKIFLFLALSGLSAVAPAQEGKPATAAGETRILDFDTDWRFNRGDWANAMMPAFDDTTWRRVVVPQSR